MRKPARQVRTCGDLQLGVDGHDLQAGFEGALDDGRSVEHITALDDQIGIVDQLVQRIGKDVRQRKSVIVESGRRVRTREICMS